MKPFTHAPRPSQEGSYRRAAVNGFFAFYADPQSGLANGPEWAALKKHGLSEYLSWPRFSDDPGAVAFPSDH
jgi:hypothetical protein